MTFRTLGQFSLYQLSHRLGVFPGTKALKGHTGWVWGVFLLNWRVNDDSNDKLSSFRIVRRYYALTNDSPLQGLASLAEALRPIADNFNFWASLKIRTSLAFCSASSGQSSFQEARQSAARKNPVHFQTFGFVRNWMA